MAVGSQLERYNTLSVWNIHSGLKKYALRILTVYIFILSSVNFTLNHVFPPQSVSGDELL